MYVGIYFLITDGASHGEALNTANTIILNNHALTKREALATKDGVGLTMGVLLEAIIDIARSFVSRSIFDCVRVGEVRISRWLARKVCVSLVLRPERVDVMNARGEVHHQAQRASIYVFTILPHVDETCLRAASFLLWSARI